MSGGPPDAVPLELRLVSGGVSLAVVWDSGPPSLIAAEALRRACRCAACTAARAAGSQVAADAGIAITALEAIGGYAVNIAFSDGHARGIYPWRLLQALRGLNPGPAPTAGPAARS